jgi:hypothetical protein
MTDPIPYINYLGLTEIEGEHKIFGVKANDRRRHTYIIGKSGMGKSTLLENMILQDIFQGHGACYIDPLGDSAVAIMDRIPKYRHKDVIYLDPTNSHYSIGLNLLDVENNVPTSLIVDEIMSIMERIWAGAWSARMEYILSNALMALIDIKGQTLLGALKMFSDNAFLDKVAAQCQNIIVKNFWNNEYKQFPPNYKTEAVAAIQNKIGQLFSNELLMNILGQIKSTIDFNDIINNKKILICNLAKGQIGEGNSNLLGSLIVTKLQMATMARSAIAEDKRFDFYLYIDEFQNFVNDSFVTILSEARKFRLNLILANQFLGQLVSTEDKDKIKQAIFGNVGTIISFQLGQQDAEEMAKEMQISEENQKYFQDLAVGQILIKPSINFKQVGTFFAYTLPQLYTEFEGNYEECRKLSIKSFTRPSTEILKEIKAYYKSEPVDNAKSRRAMKRKLERDEKIRLGLIIPKYLQNDENENDDENEDRVQKNEDYTSLNQYNNEE